jgi:hypothetical protein
MAVEFDSNIMAARQDGWSRLPVKIITAPAADNPNLQAQQGCFLGYQQFDIELANDEPFIPRPYDELLLENKSHISTSMAGQPGTLKKLRLPASEAPELLRLLSGHGVDASTVFPGLGGTVQAVQETRLWPDPDDVGS